MICNMQVNVGIVLAFMSYDNLFLLIDSTFQGTSCLHVHGPPGGSNLTKNICTILHCVLLRPRLFEQ